MAARCASGWLLCLCSAGLASSAAEGRTRPPDTTASDFADRASSYCRFVPSSPASLGSWIKEVRGVGVTARMLENPRLSHAVDLGRHAIWSANIILDQVDRVFRAFVRVKFNPADAPLAARQQWVVPYANRRALERMIERALRTVRWARPKGDAKRWKAFLAKLRSDEERATARSLRADYVYSGKLQHGFIRIDRKRKVVVETVLISDYFQALARPVPPAPARSRARLVASGLFDGKGGCYWEPHAMARLIKATAFFKNISAIAGVEPRQKPKVLAAAFRNLRQVDKLARLRPRLFESALVAGKAISWTLTPAGKRVFSRVSLPKGRDAARNKAAKVLRKALKTARGARKIWRIAKRASRSYADTSGLILLFQWPHLVVSRARSDQKLVRKLLSPRVGLRFSADHGRLVLGP